MKKRFLAECYTQSGHTILDIAEIISATDDEISAGVPVTAHLVGSGRDITVTLDHDGVLGSKYWVLDPTPSFPKNVWAGDPVRMYDTDVVVNNLDDVISYYAKYKACVKF